MQEENVELDGVFKSQQWQHAASIMCKDFYPVMQQIIFLCVVYFNEGMKEILSVFLSLCTNKYITLQKERKKGHRLVS